MEKARSSSDFQEQVNKLLDGPKTLADIWTRWRMRITLTLPRCTSGNGTKTTGKLVSNAQGKHAFVTGREDFSDAVKAIKDLRQKDEQQSNYPILPSPQTRRRPFEERQWTWSSWSTLNSVFDRMRKGRKRCGLLKKCEDYHFSKKKKKNIVKSFAYRQWTEGVNSTQHRARVTHANIFSRVAQGPDKGVRSQCCSFLLSYLE